VKRYKLPGTDENLAELIQTGGGILHFDMHKVIRSLWNKEELPQLWKLSIIILIYKKPNNTDHGNYQGISESSVSYKIYSTFSSHGYVCT
jgi:hypothetical protein